MSKRKTIEEFVFKAKKLHGDKYDYSFCEYLNNYTKIKIICNKHGEFKQTPNNHLSGNGCPDCVKNKKMNTLNFIKKSQKIHSYKYDYSLSEYHGSHNNVKIICNKHGIFIQTPTNHLSGNGCPDCGYENNSKYFMLSNNDFIKRANLIHSYKYDYSLVNYIGWDNKIEIICNKHGKFEQSAGAHLCGKGCKLCNLSKGEQQIKKYLDVNNINFIFNKRFDQCKNKHKLPFDFYLMNKNILIEYDGLQHHKSIKFFGGDNAFNLRKINDKIKTDFAKNNEIKLIRIKFDQINNIKEILNNIL
jgi:very-short-patch-repair endonuclease